MRRMIVGLNAVIDALSGDIDAIAGCPIMAVNAETNLPDPTAQKTLTMGRVYRHPDGLRSCYVLRMGRNLEYAQTVLNAVRAKPAGSRTPKERAYVQDLEPEADFDRDTWDPPKGPVAIVNGRTGSVS